MATSTQCTPILQYEDLCAISLTKKGNIYYINDYVKHKIYQIYTDSTLMRLLREYTALSFSAEKENYRKMLKIAIYDYVKEFRGAK